jgi:hypothetical protein
MPSVSDSVQSSRTKSIRVALLSSLLYQIAALLCLRHWRSSTPWQDLDFFSSGFFVLNALLLLRRFRFSRGIFNSREGLSEASGLNYDPVTIRLGTMLAVADLLVFLDYAHWHLIPALRQPCKGLNTVEAWILREGFQRGVEILQRELSALRDLVPALNSPNVASYLDLREMMLEGQKTRIGEAFQVLETVATVTEEPTVQTSD